MTKSTSIYTAALLICGLILNFVFTGHRFIAYALYLAAILIILFNIAGKKLRKLICIVLAVCLVYFIIVEIPIVKSSFGEPFFDAQYIIVLGAAVHGDTPSLSLVERLEAARLYLTEHTDTFAILSGGQGDGENLSEAQAMFNWLCDKGIDSTRLITEDKSTSTLENLQNSFDIIYSRGDSPEHNTAIVTSEYHIYRAKLIGKTLGVELHAFAAHTSYLTVRINYFIREAFGVTYQWIFG